MRSGELAKLTGVSTDTLRHYERLGMPARPKRTDAGYRLYPAVKRIQLARRALGVGFTLGEAIWIFAWSTTRPEGSLMKARIFAASRREKRLGRDKECAGRDGG